MNEKSKLRRRQILSIGITVLGIFLLSMLMTLSTSDLQADSINPSVYSIDEKPNGLTFGEWTENFWRWVISIPQQNNPNLDPTGEKCTINQTDPNVWYLAPTFGGAAERTCEIPADRAILFPLLVSECDYLGDPELRTESELRTCAKQGQDSGSRTMAASVDGTQLKNLEKYRVESQLFDLTYPADNVFSVAPGRSKAISDGYWVFLKPLPSGNHDIDFSASIIDPSGVNNYNTQVKYHLIVKEPTNSTNPS